MSKRKKNILIYSFSGIVLLFLIAFTGQKNSARKIKNVEVDVELEDGNYFTDEFEVLDLMTIEHTDFLLGSRMGDIKPKVLEERVEANPFVKDAQVYRDLKGNIKVNVTQSKPIARVFVDGKNDKYIDTEGNILPVNARHTARVPVLETSFKFSWKENMSETEYGSRVFNLLEFIEKDDFWRAQIAHVHVKKNGEVELLPQITKQTIEIGMPDDLEKKFDKLMIFYKEILPKKGWNAYSRVNLKYENQVICE